MRPKGRGAKGGAGRGLAGLPCDSAGGREAEGLGRGAAPGCALCREAQMSLFQINILSLLTEPSPRRCLPPLSRQSTPSCPDRRKWLGGVQGGVRSPDR